MIVEITEERANEVIEKVSRFVAERHMAPAAILAIESLRPLSFIGSQALFFIEPFAQVFVNEKEYQEFATMIEKEENLKKLMRRIDELDYEIHKDEREKSKIKKLRRKKKIKNFFKKFFKKK